MYAIQKLLNLLLWFWGVIVGIC